MAFYVQRMSRGRRRLWILLALLAKGEQQPYTLAKTIAECINEKVTKREIETVRRAIYRSIGLLEKAWLIERTPHGVIKLTPFGTLVAWRIYDPEEWFAAPLAAKRIEEYYEPLRGISVIAALAHIVGKRAERSSDRFYIREAFYAIEDGERLEVESTVFKLSLRRGELPRITLYSKNLCLSFRHTDARSNELIRVLDDEDARQLFAGLIDYGVIFEPLGHIKGLKEKAIQELAEFIGQCIMDKNCSCNNLKQNIIQMLLGYEAYDPDILKRYLEVLSPKECMAIISGIAIANSFYKITWSNHVFPRAAVTLVTEFSNIIPKPVMVYVLENILLESSFMIDEIAYVIEAFEKAGYKNEALELLERVKACIIRRCP
jgi:hypothetical protein